MTTVQTQHIASPAPPKVGLRLRLARWIAGRHALASVASQVDDSAGWAAFAGGPHDRDASEIQQQYTDALEAWRKNPMAKRIIDTTTDYCLGDGMVPSAPATIGRFLRAWWTHPKNQMDLRLPELSDELARAGDLFVTLHRNPEDGVSYVRPIPKDRITKIDTAPNDWETELAYHERATDKPTETRRWLSPHHPRAAGADAVMVHYSVNRVVGCLLGESDLGTIIPWLLRYSRLIEDRVRLHWAARAFLWMVTVPTAKVAAKREQYRTAPESGSIIVKDETETWQPVAASLQGFDAQFDMRAVRQLIDAGSGLPPHWRGEAHDVSLATANAMEHAASRHLRRRQLTLKHLVRDLAHLAYARAWQIGKVRARPDRKAIAISVTDLDRDDNRDLAQAAQTIAQAFQILGRSLPGGEGSLPSPRLQRLALHLVTKFAGEPLDAPSLEAIMAEIAAGKERYP